MAERVMASRVLHAALKNEYMRKKEELFAQVGNKCILCGGKANSLHHVMPLAYCTRRYKDIANTPFNVVPCCHDWQHGKNCHFRLNGASWVVINRNRQYLNIWTPEQWIETIRNWIFEHINELKHQRAAFLYPKK